MNDIQYTLERLWAGQLGNGFIVLSFVSAFLAFIAFYLSSKNSGYLKLARFAFNLHGFAVVGMTLHHPSRPVVPMSQVRLDDAQPRALVLGSERQGLSDAALEACTILTNIPMAVGIDSLNVASATAIACYALK
jgi:tRNA G18 (ribose-2'-O)-methylase SpoU